jgi:hypothetical protein
MEEDKTKVLVRDAEGNHNFGENPELMAKFKKDDKQSDTIFKILYSGIAIIIIAGVILYFLYK